MASNFFGQFFRITTFGESHGPSIGVVIDGCPPLLSLEKEEIDLALKKRAPGNSPFTSQRKEPDTVEILSGVFRGKTTGAPIALLIRNQDQDPSSYASIETVLRPGHANASYLQKYGIFDPFGGGRASARETAVRVAAGVVAKKLLQEMKISTFISELGAIAIETLDLQRISKSPLFCPDEQAENKMTALLEEVKKEKDSLGGIVECIVDPMIKGLGDPVYGKLEALLAMAMLSIPASKGFEMGAGFLSARMRGSQHNDPFCLDAQGEISTESNFAGGTLGGISTGQPLRFRVAFKPTSSIGKPQKTLSIHKEKKTLEFPSTSRHDPCVAIRAVPVVEAMTALVLADLVLMNKGLHFFS